MTDINKMVTDLAMQFSNKWACPHPRQVGLGNSDDFVDRSGPNTRSNQGISSHWVGRSYEGVGPVVQIKECGLCTFEKNALPGM